MADNKGEQTASCGNGQGQGNEWEVVTLTASAYAAAPGPDGVELIHEEKGDNATGGDEVETSQTLFMSGHFVFPPSKHENLSREPDKIEVHKKDKVSGAAEILSEEGGRSEQKGDENWNIKGLNVPEDFSSIYDDKGNKLSIHGQEFEEATALHGLKVANMEREMYSDAKFSSFHTGTNTDEVEIYEESTVPTILPDPLELKLDPSDRLHYLTDGAGDKHDRPKLPPGAWWKRKVASLCAHAKEPNTFWSVFIAAAVMGLVILGQRWQQERWQVLQQRWQLSVNAEKSGGMLSPLSRFKDIIVGGSQRASYIKNGAAAER